MHSPNPDRVAVIYLFNVVKIELHNVIELLK